MWQKQADAAFTNTAGMHCAGVFVIKEGLEQPQLPQQLKIATLLTKKGTSLSCTHIKSGTGSDIWRRLYQPTAEQPISCKQKHKASISNAQHKTVLDIVSYIHLSKSKF